MDNGGGAFFWKQFLLNPRRTGALLPSSGSLAAKMLECARLEPDSVVAEFGPGTGAFTEGILRALSPAQKFFAIEANPDFAAGLRRRFPELSLHQGCASEIGECCRREGVDRVDRVISGLPWAVFPDDLRDGILGAMLRIMPKGGIFVTFAYLQGLLLPAGRRFRRELDRRFSRIEKSGVVWRNLPPAIVYQCFH
ncbi:MAG: ribosomal RNA adenine dimethylase domain-containing protein [Planctomycetota bacterium]|nr:ribosomal RNA adenine dimethylase domain-containing protein [Planctomycetota bacterium]